MFNKNKFISKNFNKIKDALLNESSDKTKKDVKLNNVIIKDVPCEVLPSGEEAFDLNTASLLITADKELKSKL